MKRSDGRVEQFLPRAFWREADVIYGGRAIKLRYAFHSEASGCAAQLVSPRVSEYAAGALDYAYRPRA
jgi:hypothetical protein